METVAFSYHKICEVTVSLVTLGEEEPNVGEEIMGAEQMHIFKIM